MTHLEINPENIYREGRIICVTGPVCSGKSNKLITYTEQFDSVEKEYIIFKPFKDKRDLIDGKAYLKGRGGFMKPAIPIKNSSEIKPEKIGKSIVVIDEAQFLDIGLIDKIDTLANQGATVIIAGLRQDSNRRPYKTIAMSLAMADEAHYLHGYCVICSKKGVMRAGQLSWKIEEPGKKAKRNDCKAKYIPVCRGHHRKLELGLVDPALIDYSKY